MKFLLKLALLILIAVIAYNYFMGTQDEKEQSQDIIESVEDLGKSIAGLIKMEKDKYDKGKYDDAIEKTGELIQTLKSKIQDLQLGQRLKQLDDKKGDLRKRLDELTEGSREMSSEERNELDQSLEELMKELDEIANSEKLNL